MSEVIAGIRIPDSKLAREATDLLREHGTGVASRPFSAGLLLRSDPGPLPWADVRSRSCCTSVSFPLISDSPRSIAVRTTDSRSIVRTRPENSCGPTVSMKRPSRSCGTRLCCTQRRRSRGTSGRRSCRSPALCQADVLAMASTRSSVSDRQTAPAAYPRIDFKQGIVQAFSNGFASQARDRIWDDEHRQMCRTGHPARLPPAELLRSDRCQPAGRANPTSQVNGQLRENVDRAGETALAPTRKPGGGTR